MRINLTGAAAVLTLTMFLHSVSAYQSEANMTQEFLKAVTSGEVAKVQAMLKTDPRLAYAKDPREVSAILKATYSGQKEVAAVLLASGIELNVFEAAATGQTDRLRALVKRDASLVNAFSSDGFMPLGLAVFFGHLETVEALLAAGAEVNATTRESMKVTPLHSAAAARQAAIARVLIAHGARVNAAQEETGFTPLHEAALNGDIEFAKLLLEHGAEVNAKMKDGKTPLTFALKGGQTEMSSFLRERGAVK